MNNKQLFHDTYSKITLSGEKRKELIAMGSAKKPKHRFRMTKAAAAAIALCFLVLAGGSITYAVTDGKVFNNLGNWLKATITINGESQESQITQKPNGDFIIKYGTEDSGGEFEIDGDKNSTCMLLELDFAYDKGRVNTTKVLKIHENYSHENQLWEIREQIVPWFPDAYERSSEYLKTLTQAAQKLEGVWKEGVLLAVEDLRLINAGHKIVITDYDYEKPERGDDNISWLYIDYTDKDPNAEFTQMSNGGYITEFQIRFENGELREYAPVKKTERFSSAK